jgi:hypothetical protein
MKSWYQANKATILKVLVPLALFMLGGATATIVVDDPGGGPARTIVVHVPRPTVLTATVSTATPGQTATVTAPANVVLRAAPGLEGGLHAEQPSAINVAAQDAAAKRDDLPVVTPDAAPSQRGCISRFVSNYSSRRGVAPRIITLHETVSPDVPGWADVNAIVGLFDRPASQASSNYVEDREGHCAYIVRETDKAWTQAAGNPWSISFELINPADGRVRNLIDGPGRKKLISIIVDISKRWNIPLRRGAVSGCVPRQAGIIDHFQWGLCGGGHVDVTPNRRAIDPIISDARALCQRRYRAAHHPIPARCRG